jgi:hypothetical protein
VILCVEVLGPAVVVVGIGEVVLLPEFSGKNIGVSLKLF